MVNFDGRHADQTQVKKLLSLNYNSHQQLTHPCINIIIVSTFTELAHNILLPETAVIYPVSKIPGTRDRLGKGQKQLE